MAAYCRCRFQYLFDLPVDIYKTYTRWRTVNRQHIVATIYGVRVYIFHIQKLLYQHDNIFTNLTCFKMIEDRGLFYINWLLKNFLHRNTCKKYKTRLFMYNSLILKKLKLLRANVSNLYTLRLYYSWMTKLIDCCFRTFAHLVCSHFE